METASQRVSIPGTMSPPISHQTTKTTGSVDIKKFRRALFVIAVGAFGSSATVDAKLQESSDNSSFSDVSSGSVTQLVAAGGDNRLVTMEIRADQLTSGKRYVRASLTVGTAASLTCAVPIGLDAIQKPGSGNDDTSVAQRLVM